VSEVFVRRPPWRLWCELVAREVRGDASPEDAAEVRRQDNLIAWMRALNQLKCDTEAHDGDARLRLKSLAPTKPGEPPSEHYLGQKREFEWRHAGRVKFMRGVAARIEECRHLLHAAGIDWRLTVGDLLGSLLRIEELLMRDDIDGALGVARTSLDRGYRAGAL
jgi:hypothetical protein